MHTFAAGEKENETVFLFNSDLSGDVVITRNGNQSLHVPGEHLLSFVANYVRDTKIGELEQMNDNEILGITSR